MTWYMDMCGSKFDINFHAVSICFAYGVANHQWSTIANKYANLVSIDFEPNENHSVCVRVWPVYSHSNIRYVYRYMSKLNKSIFSVYKLTTLCICYKKWRWMMLEIPHSAAPLLWFIVKDIPRMCTSTLILLSTCCYMLVWGS